ncbi:BCCT family transporter [Lysinibacillus macroides]|uniref:Glycine/betaine ABC transporter permease n=1 Tax=Lysinibacillus macroides TaxID=33935 RepID=A0A0M9DHL8_9BACI|nr:BCCT family transporter [Lysinibacillus macroides]KOY80342.1 glycine/betaine ABC transporter permease [Lysinibacillus macroides]QPR67652.1 BCCT family transporter [Lysinibacillus macroides]
MHNKILKNPVFIIASGIILLLVVIGAILPEQFKNVANSVYHMTTDYFSWFYLLAVFSIVIFLFGLAISKYGTIRLGSQEGRPEFSFLTWISMLFSAGLGVGLVFWGVAEPMSHYFSSPFSSTESLTADAARLAMGYAFFHWGLSQWSVYAILGLVMAYVQFNKKRDLLISTALEPVAGTNRAVKGIVDILAVIATIMGVATSIGLGVLQANGGLSFVFGLPDTFLLQVMIIAIMFIGYMVSATTGLQKGMKILSNVNMALAIILLLFVFITGPTVFILETFTLAIGDYISNFIQYSLRMQPYVGGTWVKDWTIFYWAWAIAWSPFVGSFIARVSKGRTIREFIIGVLIIPPLIACFWIAVFGGTALWLDLQKNAQIAQTVSNDVTVALFQMLEHLPLSMIASALGILLIFIFLITSADSATFIMASMTTKGSLNPSVWSKLIWGVLMAAISGVLLYTGGLEALQTASLIAALPFTVILLLLMIAFIKMMKNEIIPVKKKDIQRLKIARKHIEKEAKAKNKN